MRKVDSCRKHTKTDENCGYKVDKNDTQGRRRRGKYGGEKERNGNKVNQVNFVVLRVILVRWWWYWRCCCCCCRRSSNIQLDVFAKLPVIDHLEFMHDKQNKSIGITNNLIYIHTMYGSGFLLWTNSDFNTRRFRRKHDCEIETREVDEKTHTRTNICNGNDQEDWGVTKTFNIWTFRYTDKPNIHFFAAAARSRVSIGYIIYIQCFVL